MESAFLRMSKKKSSPDFSAPPMRSHAERAAPDWGFLSYKASFSDTGEGSGSTMFPAVEPPSTFSSRFDTKYTLNVIVIFFMLDTETKILIVEDDNFLQELAKQKFTKEGFHVVCEIDGERGVALAESELPDAILLDILLPGIDGFEALKRIRANPALEKTHIFMLSNYSQPEERERAANLGAEKFLVKADFTLDQIVDAVKESLAKPRS